MMVVVINFVVFYLEKVLRMEVSRKKSTVVASLPSVAVAIATNVNDGAVKAADHAKLLGSDFVVGARRSMVQFTVRHQTFK